MTSAHTVDWFQKRAGKEISRNGKTFKIPNKESAPYCHQLQREGFFFSDILQKAEQVSSGPPNVCIACEG